MSQCSNCNQSITCGCQRRNASNGVQVCSNCLSSYESQIKNVNQSPIVIEEETKIANPTNNKIEQYEKISPILEINFGLINMRRRIFCIINCTQFVLIHKK